MGDDVPGWEALQEEGHAWREAQEEGDGCGNTEPWPNAGVYGPNERQATVRVHALELFIFTNDASRVPMPMPTIDQDTGHTRLKTLRVACM